MPRSSPKQQQLAPKRAHTWYLCMQLSFWNPHYAAAAGFFQLQDRAGPGSCRSQSTLQQAAGSHTHSTQPHFFYTATAYLFDLHPCTTLHSPAQIHPPSRVPPAALSHPSLLTPVRCLLFSRLFLPVQFVIWCWHVQYRSCVLQPGEQQAWWYHHGSHRQRSSTVGG